MANLPRPPVLRSLLPLLLLPTGTGCGLVDDLALRPQLPDIEIPDVDIENGFPGGLPVFPPGFGPFDRVGPDGLPLRGESIGGECREDSACRTALTCQNNVCRATGAAAETEPCLSAQECASGLTCGPLGRCQPAGQLDEGETCVDPFSCAPGLRCNVVGFFGFCQPEGPRDIGQPCTTSTDCNAPLGCGLDGVCRMAVLGGLNFPPTATCAPAGEETPFGVYFELPPADEATPWDFYRLPFPNDALIRNGGIDLSRHQNPGPRVLGGDIVALYLDALQTSFEGFGLHPTIFFRFTQTPDFQTIVAQGDTQSLFFVNIDPDSPNYGSSALRSWSGASSAQPFLCPNWLAVRSDWDSPLEPGTTYAAWLTTSVRSGEGALPARSPELEALLSASRPGDPRLAEAWDRWAPLRTYFDTERINRVNIAGATVFTTATPHAWVEPVRTTARTALQGGFQSLTRCEAGATSPCAALVPGTACRNQAQGYTEVHALWQAPVLQRGTRPFFSRDQGGDVQISGERAVLAGNETVCVSLAIPDGEMPEEGWPAVIYSHGTGGSFLSHLNDVARPLSRVNLPDLPPAEGEEEPTPRSIGFISVGYDGVQHANRRGTGEQNDLDPEYLFYNFLNPLAARGNIQQGAGDLFALHATLESLAWSAGESPTGEAVRVDPAHIYFIGHSQGAQVGAPYVAFEPNLRAAIFSGAGGSLSLSLLSKSSPVDIASGVRLILAGGRQDQAPNVTSNDPVLSLLQWYIDPVDSLSFTRFYVERPRPERGGVHVLQTFGFGDTYSPEDTQWAFAASSGLRQATPGGAAIRANYPTSELPVRGNRFRGEEFGQLTAVVLAAQPEGYDGHFVLFRNSTLMAQAMEFLATAYFEGLPQVSAP
jgi:hypothetical protein